MDRELVEEIINSRLGAFYTEDFKEVNRLGRLLEQSGVEFRDVKESEEYTWYTVYRLAGEKQESILPAPTDPDKRERLMK